ncbi:hypothetical protein J2129_002333 [Methanofollis sp. W23]|uniref:hypothetical protein n=1 Tax=Methanofollis sp. W23 TaxID=2817849 RepID=UPI001AE137D5|nr:hypothetical protein [Methanofollis sp. W23]MBP2146879.1 hypothetical protein [Methanofollis sp. W23]
MTRPLLIVLLLIGTVLIAGCTGTGTTLEPVVASVDVPYDYLYVYELWGEKGTSFSIEINTDGAPVDLLVFNRANYIKYKKAFENSTQDTWKAVIYRDVVSKEFTYTLPHYGTHYLVIENSEFTTDGADAKRDVNVSVRIE